MRVGLPAALFRQVLTDAQRRIQPLRYRRNGAAVTLG